MRDMKTEFLYSVSIDFGGMQDIGDTPHGHRLIVKAQKGTFEGPKLKGEILPGGGDWFLVRPDGVGEIDVRDTYRTHDGELIYIYYRGILSNPTVIERINQGEKIDSSEYYFRTTPYFETGSKKYGWLNQTVAVAIGMFKPLNVSYDVYAIL